MSQRISATDAARHFSELLNRVRYRGESFDVVRGGEVVARLAAAPTRSKVVASQLVAVLADTARPDGSFAADLERIQDEQPQLPEDPWVCRAPINER